MTPRRPRPSTLERAVIAAYAAADWVTDADVAAYWLTRDLALIWDGGLRRQGTLDGSAAIPPRDLVELAGRIALMLRELALTPAARHRMGLGDEVDDAFASVLSLAQAKGGDGTN